MDTPPLLTPPERPARFSMRELGCLLFAVLGALFVAWAAWALAAGRPLPWVPSTPTVTISPSPTSTVSPSPSPVPPTPTLALTAPPTPAPLTFPDGLVVLALRVGVARRLFAYAPPSLPLLPLAVPGEDFLTPALSPDGRTLAYAAHTPHGWDLFLLSLDGSEPRPLTDTPAYDGAPSWSPDGQWLVYETDSGANLDLVVRDAAGTQPPIPLTTHPAADYQPAWSPQGRVIAFISTREGLPQVFLANLDRPPEDRFRRVSDPANGPAAHPAWSPDGRYLAWAQVGPDGLHRLYLWDLSDPERPPRPVAQGDWPLFAPQGDRLLALLTTPYETYLTAYTLDGSLALPPLRLPGPAHGWTVGAVTLPWPGPLVATPLTPTPLWTPAITPHPDLPAGRYAVVELPGLQAPHPALSDAADEAFTALRQTVAQLVGWDALGRLDYAYTPLTEPLLPGFNADWLNTGRAFALSSIPLQAGWIVVVREDYGPQTYWRVFLRTQAQDGSQGLPLHALPWDLLARYRPEVTLYEEGGTYLSAVPFGYWVDFTELAAAYGWERLPALVNWRAYLPGARWNLFVLRQGLTLEEALLQIYPAEALRTPTPAPTPVLNWNIPTPTEEGP